MKLVKSLLLSTYFIFNTAIADDSNKISVIGYAPHPAIEQHYLHIIQQSYLKIGLNPDFVPVSDKRSIKMLSENKLDGLVVRTENIIRQQPNFTPVPPALGIVEITLICQQQLTCNTDIFNNSDKILGLVAQEEYYQELLEGKKINIYEVGNYQRMELMFKQKKIDAMIMVFDLNTQDIKSLKLNTLTLAKRKGFHMIHKRFSYLIPKLSPSLKQTLAEHDFNKS